MGNFSDRHHCQKVCVYGGTDGRRGGAACCRGLTASGKRTNVCTAVRHPLLLRLLRSPCRRPGGGGHLYRHPQHPALRKLQALLGAGQARFVRKTLYHQPGTGAATVPSGRGKAPFSHGGILDLAAAAVRPPAPDPCGWHHRGAEADHLSVRLCSLRCPEGPQV